jgi:hypothetical protein
MGWMSVIVLQDATIYRLLYFCKMLYMFPMVNAPIIRTTYSCNYSIWYWSNRLRYLPFWWISLKLEIPTFPPQRKVAETVWPVPDVVITAIQGVPLTTKRGISLIILKPMKIFQRDLNGSTFVVWEMKRNVFVVCVCFVAISLYRVSYYLPNAAVF